MATGDMIARLLLNSADFDTKLKKSKKGVQDFEKKGNDLGNVVGAAFKKIAVAAVSIKTAQKAWDAFFSSSQARGDALASTMHTLDTVTGNFTYAVSNADFSSFTAGLGEIVKKAREAYAAMDQLGNTVMASSYVQATSGSVYRTAMAKARNKDLSVEERQAALAEARAAGEKIKTAADVTAKNSMDALRKQLAADTGLSETQISDEALQKYFELDATATFKEQREELEAKYQEYLNRIEGIKDKYPVTLEVLFGSGSGKKGKNQKVRQELIASLGEEFKDVIVGYQLLFRESDEDLAKMYETAKSATAAKNQAAEIVTATNEVAYSIGQQVAVIKKKNEELKAAAEDTAKAYKALHESTKLFDTTAVRPGQPNKSEAPKTIEMIEVEPWDTDNIKSIEEIGETLQQTSEMVDMLAGSFGNLSNAVGGTAGEIFGFLENTLSASQGIIQMIDYLHAEKIMHDQNASSAMREAAAKSLSAYAGIPFAGIAMGLSTAAMIVSTIKSIPKFAEGGVVTGATLGVFGEAGPEAVMPLDRLQDFIKPQNIRVSGEIKADGKNLKVVIDNYNKIKAVK